VPVVNSSGPQQILRQPALQKSAVEAIGGLQRTVGVPFHPAILHKKSGRKLSVNKPTGS
jgi:hypothetical protein